MLNKNMMAALLQLLTKQLEKKFEYTKNSLLPEEAQQAIKQERNENEQEEDEESHEEEEEEES